MLPYSFYKVLHLLGLLLAFTAVGGVAWHAAAGGAKASSPGRGYLAAVHGTGMLFLLVGGFGMLARLGFQHGALFPGWLWGKLAVWLLVTVAVIVPYRRPAVAKPMLVVVPALGAVAAWLAVYKPF
jgi:hypothetical protein